MMKNANVPMKGMKNRAAFTHNATHRTENVITHDLNEGPNVEVRSGTATSRSLRASPFLKDRPRSTSKVNIPSYKHGEIRNLFPTKP